MPTVPSYSADSAFILSRFLALSLSLSRDSRRESSRNSCLLHAWAFRKIAASLSLSMTEAFIPIAKYEMHAQSVEGFSAAHVSITPPSPGVHAPGSPASTRWYSALACQPHDLRKDRLWSNAEQIAGLVDATCSRKEGNSSSSSSSSRSRSRSGSSGRRRGSGVAATVL